MKYLNMLCPSARYYAKFDIDSYVFINKVLDEINLNKRSNYQFWGAEKQIWKYVNPDQSFKYSSPWDTATYYSALFPKQGIYVYSGFATIFTSDIPSLLYNESLKNPKLLRIDDQYISWLLYKLKIKINKLSSYAILPNKCRIYKNVSIIHRITYTDMISYSIYYKTDKDEMHN